MVDIELDLSCLEELESLEGKMEGGLSHIVQRGAEVVFQSKLQEISATDKRQIPTRGQVRSARRQQKAEKPVRVKGGRKNIGVADPTASDKDNEPAWERNGEWAEGQRIEETGQFERTITTVGPAANYEGRLANLPDGALGINRTNKASENARNKTELQLEAVLEAELRNYLDI